MGIKSGVAKAGIKPSGDYDILVMKFNSSVYSLYLTQNSLSAAPVIYDRKIRETEEKISAIVVNSGNANAATGEEGLRNAEEMAKIVAGRFNISPSKVLVFSTGIIGVQLPMDKVRYGINKAIDSLTDWNIELSARAIMTTDSFPKYAEETVEIEEKKFFVKGISKGAGMIHPSMATMLAYIFTDVKIEKKLLDEITKEVLEKTFNSIDVDGCESTNDSVLFVATGEADVVITEENRDLLFKPLHSVALKLAKMIVKDGEGATKIIEIDVKGAKSEEEAKKVGEIIALSNLFKTAMFGNDPNWGRILSAVGQLHTDIDFSKVKLFIGDFLIYDGKPLDFDRKEAENYLKTNDEVKVELILNRGKFNWKYFTSDLTYKYIEINAEYTT